jgi:hypothetical protein
VGKITDVEITDPGSGYVNPTPAPKTLLLTISGNGVTYGPFTLVKNSTPIAPWTQGGGPCGWTLNTTVDVAATASCPAMTGVGLQLNVQWGLGGWALTAQFLVAAVLGTNGCVGLIGYSCVAKGGAGLGSTTVMLLPCPSRPYAVTVFPVEDAQPSFFIQNLAYLYLLFGGSCMGAIATPPSFPVAFTLSEP